MKKCIGIVCTALVLFLSSGCGGGGGSGNNMHTVRYEVSSYSHNPYDITYVDENGNSQTLTNKDVYDGWSYQFTAAAGTVLSLSTTLRGPDNEVYWVAIYLDDGPNPVTELNQTWPDTPATIEYTIPEG